MKVTCSDGNTYKVQFVHSSHNLKSANGPVTPGGLRQFVDNLAKSLRRRVTFADISLVRHVVPQDSGETYDAYESLSQGFAVCHHTDVFQKKIGRVYALDRALLNSNLPVSVQIEIWEGSWEGNKWVDVVPERASDLPNGHYSDMSDLLNGHYSDM